MTAYQAGIAKFEGYDTKVFGISAEVWALITVARVVSRIFARREEIVNPMSLGFTFAKEGIGS